MAPREGLAFAAGAALLAAGGAGLAVPRTAARAFGVTVEEAPSLAYVQAAAARDLVLGVLILGARHDPSALRRLFRWSATIGLADAVSVGARRGLRPQHLAHLGGALALAWAAHAV